MRRHAFVLFFALALVLGVATTVAAQPAVDLVAPAGSSAGIGAADNAGAPVDANLDPFAEPVNDAFGLDPFAGAEAGLNAPGDIVVVYDGLGRRNRAFTLQRVGSELRAFSGAGGATLMTKKGTRIYDGRRITLDSIIFTIRSNRIIPGKVTNVTLATCTIVGKRMFDGTTTTLQNLKYTITGNRLYMGTSRLSADVKYTVEGFIDTEVAIMLAVLADC